MWAQPDGPSAHCRHTRWRPRDDIAIRVCAHAHAWDVHARVYTPYTRAHLAHSHTHACIHSAHVHARYMGAHVCVHTQYMQVHTHARLAHTGTHACTHTAIVSPPMKTKSLLQQELTFSKITVRGFLPPDAEPRSPPCPRRPGAEGAHGSVAAGNTWPGWRGREPRGRAGASGSGRSLRVGRQPQAAPAARAPVRGASLAERPSGSMTEAHCHLR